MDPQLVGVINRSPFSTPISTPLYLSNPTPFLLHLQSSQSSMAKSKGRPRLPVEPCAYCGKQFKRREHLVRHERIRKSNDTSQLGDFDADAHQTRVTSLLGAPAGRSSLASKRFAVQLPCVHVPFYARSLTRPKGPSRPPQPLDTS